MIHLDLSLASRDLDDHEVVSDMLDVDTEIGFVQAAGGDDEITRSVAGAHIAACEGLVAVISGHPDSNQRREIRTADAAGVPVFLLSEGAAVDIVEDHPLQTFHPESFIEFVSQVSSRSQSSP